jgi:ubiquitin-conjugating enzyme E2 D/E
MQNDEQRNYTVQPRENNIFIWDVTFKGPEGTPYEGGWFQGEIKFPADYPLKPLVLALKTQIWHPNISEKGEICKDVIAWKPSVTVESFLEAFYARFAEPDPEATLRVEAAEQFKFRRSEFDQQAREWTAKYAATQPA